jgi:hypothetical protein
VSRCADGGLGGVAVKTERKCNAPDHVRCQNLYDERDKIGGHVGFSSRSRY